MPVPERDCELLEVPVIDEVGVTVVLRDCELLDVRERVAELLTVLVELAVHELVAPAVNEPDSDGVAGGVAVLE